MKKFTYGTYFNFNFGLAACGGKDKDEKKLVVGASNVPHAVILEKAKPLLEKKELS